MEVDLAPMKNAITQTITELKAVVAQLAVEANEMGIPAEPPAPAIVKAKDLLAQLEDLQAKADLVQCDDQQVQSSSFTLP